MKRVMLIIVCMIMIVGLIPTGMAAQVASTKKITITGSKYVAKGKSVTLKANQDVTWKSSDKKIATVSESGKVKGVKAGKVTITATSKNGKEKKSWKMTVMKKAASKVTIQNKIDSLQVGDSFELQAKASPSEAAQAFTWKSSNTKVAKVTADGIVTALKEGTVKISTNASDGSKKTASITISIVSKPKKAIRVGIINNPPSESGYREANVRDFEKVFSALNGYDTMTFYTIMIDEQLNAARQFINDGVDYLLISAADPFGWVDVLKDAQEAGTTVFLFDRMIDCDPSLYAAAIVTDMSQEGKTAVFWLKSLGLEAYNVIHIQGAIGSEAQLGRTGALDAEFAAGTMKKVVQQSAYWDESEAKRIVESVINSGEDFNVIYAENDGMAKGAVAALDAAGITHGVDGKVIIMGFDCNRWALQELLAGDWNYDGQCSPFQADAINDMILTLESGGKIKGLNALNQYFIKEKGFDARYITESDIARYGLGD